MTVEWAVYDNTNDDIIGVWEDMYVALDFLCENEGVQDNWEVFPMLECTVPVV
jgi:hypothetical protein|tara:strand:+ start:529 stop:687 length:159 start_codon:yes stop_codon:yes gene_type:complete